jgi:hypothetical protein
MTKAETPPLRDLLYLDFDKAASIWSQFEEGLPERMSVTEDTGKTRAAGTKFGVGVAGANLTVDYLDKRSTLQSKTLHHDVLNRVEQRLEEVGLVTDLAEAVNSDESSADKIRHAIAHRPYLRAEGSSVLEDYRRILTISEKFNDLVGFIGKSGQQAVKQSPEFKQLEQLVAAAREAADKMTDRNQKSVQRGKAKAAQRQLEDLAKPKLGTVDQWILDGIRLWINTFMPNRINFRIYPFASCPSFHVLCNLKRDCFVDSDLEHLLYGYGNRPNVRLAVFGLITSLPQEGESTFDPMREFETNTPLPERVAFEKAFRAMFGGMEGLESFVRYSRYPNVTVHPIAVYRSFSVGENAG